MYNFIILLLATCVSLGLTEVPEPYTEIVGGTKAERGEFKYQVSVQILTPNGYGHFCGGSVLDNTTVLTAAHCIPPLSNGKARSLRIVAGEYRLYTIEKQEQARKISQTIKHENYSSRTYHNDIALLKFDDPLIFNDDVQPIVLPDEDTKASGTCVVTGWGHTKSGGHGSSTLLKGNVTIIADKLCGHRYNRLSRKIFDDMVCAVGEGVDACQGDSGGPLYCDGYQAGIVSWGIGCALKKYPGVYTELSYFTDWIEENKM